MWIKGLIVKSIDCILIVYEYLILTTEKAFFFNQTSGHCEGLNINSFVPLVNQLKKINLNKLV